MKKTIFLMIISISANLFSQNWSLNGNSGTNSSNFIGTTDATDVIFKTDNNEWMRMTTYGRIIFQNIDTGLGWNNNLFLGGGNGNSTGVANLVLGLGAFINNTTGGANVAIGANSLRNNLTGSGNVSVGTNASMQQTTGNYNISLGGNALTTLTVGDNNTAIGHQALAGGSGYNMTGSNNTAVGKSSLQGLRDGSSYNTIIGSSSFVKLRSGNGNISLGYNSLITELSNANNNIYIGNNLSNKVSPPNNELNIGNWIIGNNGTIGIGQFSNELPSDGISTDGKKYKLFVKDGIKTEKVKVEIAAENGWADYVFDKDYQLMPLKELESFISKNGHLPEVPTIQQAIENGIELKEMNILLLKKVEELTLHLIEQNKRIEELESKTKK